MNQPDSAAKFVDESPLLRSRAVVLLTGLSYLFVGLGFSFLDRRFGSFGFEGLLWFVWAALGFGAGAFNIGRSASAGKLQLVVQGFLGVLLVIAPGFAIFNLLRWAALALMVVIGARAAVLKTQRDLYFTLMVIFVVSFMVGTHGNADWTLWFYLGPAWVFGGLALAWDHAAGVALSRWTKMVMTLVFISASFLLAFVIFFFAPRPPILGFGFLPPGTDTPGMFASPSGSGGQQGKGTNNGSGNVGLAQSSDSNQQWDAMFRGMRKSASDKNIPQWQRNIMGNLLEWGQALKGHLMRDQHQSAENQEQFDSSLFYQGYRKLVSFHVNWPVLLALLFAAYLLWRYRFRIGLQLALSCSWVLARGFPEQSMRMTALAVKWFLHMQGYKPLPGQSVREFWVAAPGLAPNAKRWLGYAVESYCAMRFGNVPTTPQQALRMREAVMGACDIMQGNAPELAK